MTVSAYSAILELRKLHSSSLDKNVNCQNGLDEEGSAREGWTNKMFFVII